MKKSNKILIAFGAALILIPVLGMVIVSATQYKTGTYKENVRQVENFSTPTKNMISVAVSSVFRSVNVADGKSLSLNIHLLKDEKFGVKIPETYKDLISVAVDVNGQLQIVIKDKVQSDGNRNRHYTDVYIYGPNVVALGVNNVSDLVVNSVTDSLAMDIKKLGSLYFDNGTRIKQLNLKAVDVARLSFREDDIQSINLDLEQTKLYIESNSFDNAFITTRANCEIAIGTGYDNAKKQTIKNLVLNTNGTTDLKIENTIIKNCSGKLSDETQVQMPAINLNQMYNTKK